ncbi:MAG: NAD-dependent epimerase/dehydratase family protein [Phycisphaerae bacterium]|nr:NAD-dependent epimerase/dehydratase family protein [Phycisphaerae bacterium]
MNSKKILITGGHGFLGQHLVQYLSKNPDRPALKLMDVNAAALPAGPHGTDHVESILGRDIRDYEAIAGEFAGMDCVVHLAGIVSFSLKDKALLHSVNVDGARNVLRAAAENGVRRVLHVSSVAALGYNDDPDCPIDEDYRFDWRIAAARHKYYMLTKHLADEEVAKFRNQGRDITIVYPGLMFGPGDITNSARLINAVKNGRIPFNMPGGTNIVDVRDVARGIIAILQDGPPGGDYLLSGHNLTFRHINATIAGALAVRPPRVTLPRLLNPLLFNLLLLIERCNKDKLALTADNLDSAFKFRYFDNSRARQRFGWRPHIPFEQTIADTIEWMKKDGRLE